MFNDCPKCGHSVRSRCVANATNEVDKALEQRRVTHWCDHCGHEWDTLELAESEVVRLRGLAHRAVMGGV
jgi:transcription elongation factor Elf1